MARVFKIAVSIFFLIVSCYASSINDNSPIILNDGGYIRGTVYSDQGQFLPLAEVVVYSTDYDVIDSVVTSSDGKFSISLSSGSYFISAEASDYIKEYFPCVYKISESQQITIFPSRIVDIDFRLDIGGTVSGQIVTGSDESSDFMVSAVKIDYPYEGWQLDRYFQIVNSGSYYLDGILPGYYKVFVRGKGYRTIFYMQSETFDGAQTVAINKGEIVDGIDFFLEQPGSGLLSGYINDISSHSPVNGAVVCAYQWSISGDDPNMESTITGADGYYELEVTAGYYYVSAIFENDEHNRSAFQVYYNNHYDNRLADLIQVDPMQNIPGIDFAVDLSISHNKAISGTMINPETNAPLEGVKITATDYYNGWPISLGFSDYDGNFVIENLISGVYILQLGGNNIIPSFWKNKLGWQDAEQIVLITNNIELYDGGAITQDYGTPGLSISGQVEGPDGVLADVRVYAINLDNGIIAFDKSDQFGYFCISCGLQEGDYNLFADLYGYNGCFYPEILNLHLINNPRIENIDFYLSPASVAIPVDAKPDNYQLAGNFPNPFNRGTLIKFYSEKQSKSELVIYDIIGRRINTISLMIDQGVNTIYWDGLSSDGQPVASGIYFYDVEGIVDPHKMLLLR
ncbi:MAG: hypothetical protein B6D58_04775 [candidate division Zixibacteria bacterium 4484_95]|nr:MAG: hypothetical protein B6D58_04775 [candidate division Zixibacteria bacterium 4484_95]